MAIIIIGGVLFGTILGRFFKVFILVPTCVLAIVAVLAKPGLSEIAWTQSLLEMAALIVSIQVGYAVGLAASNMPVLLQGARKSWAPHAQSAASRSLHIR